MNVRKPQTAGSVRAFTILEMCLAIGLMGMLALGIYTLASGSIELSAEMVEYQNDEAVRRRFIELCRSNIESLPGHSRVQLETVASGGYYTTYLSMVEHPAAFAFASASSRFDIHRVVLVSEVASSGFLTVRVHYLDAEADQAWRQGNIKGALEIGQSIRLLDRLRRADWRFYEPRQRLWFETWKESQGRPAMAELTLEMEGDPGPERLVFFVPASEGSGALGSGFSLPQSSGGQEAGDGSAADPAGEGQPDTGASAPISDRPQTQGLAP